MFYDHFANWIPGLLVQKIFEFTPYSKKIKNSTIFDLRYIFKQ